MTGLSSRDLLRLWEAARGRGHVEKGLALLRAACPELSALARFDLRIGERDARLIDLREATFGRRFACVASCPTCDERLEIEFAADDLRAAPSEETWPCTVRAASCEVRIRPPTSRDLWGIRSERNIASARTALLLRCICGARREDRACDPGELPDEVIDALAERMRTADPQAEVMLDLSCPACAHGWTCNFDIVSYLWAEIEAGVSRLVGEIDELARRYGWSEQAILALSPVRRQMYLAWGQA